MTKEEEQWRKLAIEALAFIGALAKAYPMLKGRCEDFATNVIAEHCGPLAKEKKNEV